MASWYASSPYFYGTVRQVSGSKGNAARADCACPIHQAHLSLDPDCVVRSMWTTDARPGWLRSSLLSGSQARLKAADKDRFALTPSKRSFGPILQCCAYLKTGGHKS